jgi:hypothetical protein
MPVVVGLGFGIFASVMVFAVRSALNRERSGPIDGIVIRVLGVLVSLGGVALALWHTGVHDPTGDAILLVVLGLPCMLAAALLVLDICRPRTWLKETTYTLDECEACGRHAIGKEHEFYYGNRLWSESGQQPYGSGTLSWHATYYRLPGTASVFLCRRCVRKSGARSVLITGLVLIGSAGLAVTCYWLSNAVNPWFRIGTVLLAIGCAGVIYFILFTLTRGYQPGSELAIRLRRKELATAGFNAFFTPNERRRLR